jgi:hypothetical protein
MPARAIAALIGLCACGSSGGRRAGPAAESGSYVKVTGTDDGVTAAGGPLMLASLR